MNRFNLKLTSLIVSFVFILTFSLDFFAKSIFAWGGQLNISKNCEKAIADLVLNPDSQVVEAKINNQETRHLEVVWGSENTLTFTAFIRWDTGETWSDMKSVTKPSECAVPSPTPTTIPSPTPTVTPIPTATLTPIPTQTVTPIPTATLTPVPTATPTPGPEPEQARCTGLSVSPQEGTAPLTVRFTGSGFDKNGPILEYEFDFGDSSGFQSRIWKQKEAEAAHRYENAGVYVASVKVKDQAGIWRDGNNDCRKVIWVRGKPQVLAATKTKSLPEAGMPLDIGVFVSLGSLGAYLYRRFKII